MNPPNIVITGGVVEAREFGDSHRALVVRSNKHKSYFFFFVKKDPEITFGDIIQMNFKKEIYSVIREPIEQSFDLKLCSFPGCLLLTLISEYLVL